MGITYTHAHESKQCGVLVLRVVACRLWQPWIHRGSSLLRPVMAKFIFLGENNHVKEKATNVVFNPVTRCPEK